MLNESKKVKPFYSLTLIREKSRNSDKEFRWKKKEKVFSVVLQLSFFLCYILTNNLHNIIVLKGEKRRSSTT